MELTPEQKAQFPAYLDKWMQFGLCTQTADRPMAEEGVREAYRAAGLIPPSQFYWLGSPLAGALVDTVLGQERAKLEGGETSKRPAAKTDYSDRIMSVAQTTIPVLEDILHHKVSLERACEALASLQLHNAAYGQHDASILCFYDFFAQVVGLEECKKLAGLNMIAQSAGWWWAYDNIAILTERPQKLNFDERGRLDSSSDWAVHYPDGLAYTLVHGVEVPEHVVLAPEKITVAEIDAERNVEVRRVMVEKYGQARYIIDSGAVLVHKDDWGELYRKEVPDDEPIHMVKVVNSTPEPDGSFKDYWIRTPPTIMTSKAAVAWTFAQEEATYVPEVQT